MYRNINNISCSLLNRYSCSSCCGVWRTATEEKSCTETSNPRTCSSMRKESSNWQTLVIQHSIKSSGRSTTRRTKDHLSLHFNPDCKCSLCLTLVYCLQCFLQMMYSEFKSEGSSNVEPHETAKSMTLSLCFVQIEVWREPSLSLQRPTPTKWWLYGTGPPTCSWAPPSTSHPSTCGEWRQTHCSRAPFFPLCFLTRSALFVFRGVGCIFYEMITGRPLFPGSTVEDELHLIFRILGEAPQ